MTEYPDYVYELAEAEAHVERLLAALILAEDVLSRSPFTTALWPDGTHPNAGITIIRDAIAKAESWK